MKIRIHVKKEDIAKGNRCGCQDCPLALAIQRQVGRPAIVHPGYGGKAGVVILYEPYLMTRLPRRASIWAVLFDEDNRVGPFSFTLDVPVKVS